MHNLPSRIANSYKPSHLFGQPACCIYFGMPFIYVPKSQEMLSSGCCAWVRRGGPSSLAQRRSARVLRNRTPQSRWEAAITWDEAAWQRLPPPIYLTLCRSPRTALHPSSASPLKLHAISPTWPVLPTQAITMGSCHHRTIS